MSGDTLTITNDDPAQDLNYKFNSADPGWCTLKPNESISMEFTTDEVLVKGTDIPYRIWSFS